MRTITIEIEGKHESAVIAQMMQAARTAARTAQDTYVFAGVDVPTRTYQKHYPDPTLRTIWGIAKSPELNLSSEDLHAIVTVQTGKDSMRKLTKKEIARVAYVLGQMKDSAKGGRTAHVRTPSVTDNQMKKLRRLCGDAGWEDKRLNGLARHMFQVETVQWLNYQQMSKLIEAVKAITKREAAKGEGLQGDAGREG